jgi:hypothetical protein
LCPQSDKDTRAVARILLLGYDIVYLERDGKHQHALRISHPGCETHMFYADSKEAAHQWLEVGVVLWGFLGFQWLYEG